MDRLLIGDAEPPRSRTCLGRSSGAVGVVTALAQLGDERTARCAPVDDRAGAAAPGRAPVRGDPEVLKVSLVHACDTALSVRDQSVGSR